MVNFVKSPLEDALKEKKSLKFINVRVHLGHSNTIRLVDPVQEIMSVAQYRRPLEQEHQREYNLLKLRPHQEHGISAMLHNPINPVGAVA